MRIDFLQKCQIGPALGYLPNLPLEPACATGGSLKLSVGKSPLSIQTMPCVECQHLHGLNPNALLTAPQTASGFSVLRSTPFNTVRRFFALVPVNCRCMLGLISAPVFLKSPLKPL